MLENLFFSLNSVLPVFVIIIVGYFLRNKGFTNESAIQKMNAIVFNFALPTMLFRDVSKTDFTQALDAKLLIFAVITSLVAIAITWVTAASMLKDKGSVGAFVQGCFRGNFAIIGLPLISNIMGGDITGKGALITTFIVPTYNIFAVIVLTVTSAESSGKRGDLIKKSFTGILKNPLIIGIGIGTVFSFLGIRLPKFAATSVDYMANLTTPLALIGIGGSINFASFYSKLKPALAVSIIKLIVTPLVFVPLAVLFGMRGEALVTLHIMYGAPTAIASYAMVCNMKGDEKLAANIVLITTILSAFTITLGVYILKTIGLI